VCVSHMPPIQEACATPRSIPPPLSAIHRRYDAGLTHPGASLLRSAGQWQPIPTRPMQCSGTKTLLRKTGERATLIRGSCDAYRTTESLGGPGVLQQYPASRKTEPTRLMLSVKRGRPGTSTQQRAGRAMSVRGRALRASASSHTRRRTDDVGSVEIDVPIQSVWKKQKSKC